MRRYPLFLPRLRMMDPQMALVLLRECYLPVTTHLIRMVEPAHTVPVAVIAPIAHYASSVQSMATLLGIVPKVGEPPDPGSASHFAFDGVGRVVESWRTLQSSPSLEG